MSKILVTGAATAAGSAAVRQLLEKGYDVRAHFMDPKDASSAPTGVEAVTGDLLCSEFAAEAVAGTRGVIHVARMSGPPEGGSEADFFCFNVGSALRIAKALAEQGQSGARFVLGSSSSVYPNDSHTVAPRYHPVDEKHPLLPVDAYGASLVSAERAVTAVADETGLEVSIVRESGVVSDQQILGRWSVGFVCAILRAGQASPRSELFMPDGVELWHELEEAAESSDQLCAATDEAGQPWAYQVVDARDLAQGLICALEHPAAVGEAFNIAAAEPIAFTEATAVLAQATAKSVLECTLPVRWLYDLDCTKAMTWIGYEPKWGIREMVEDAL